MNDVGDDAIDRVLASLRTAEPHAGLEHRVRLTLEARRAESSATHTEIAPFWRIGAMMGAMMGALAAVALAVAGATWHRAHVRTSAPAPSVTAKSFQPAVKSSPAASDTAAPDQEARQRGMFHVEQFSLPTHQHQVFRGKPTPESEAVADSPTTSFPAPQAPLTEQERLLVRVVLHSDPTYLALLDPKKREEVAAMDARNVQQFFKPFELEEKINAQQAAALPPSN